jgi:hypothetical protein
VRGVELIVARARMMRTDALIDRIVYKLYGLTAEAMAPWCETSTMANQTRRWRPANGGSGVVVPFSRPSLLR